MGERIYVDFNTMNQDIWSEERRVLIGRDAGRPLTYRGTRVLIGDEDIEVEAVLEFDQEREIWWARPDWGTRRDLPNVTMLVREPHLLA